MCVRAEGAGGAGALGELAGLGKDAGVGRLEGLGSIHGCHMQPSASVQEDPSFLNLSYLSPRQLFLRLALWLTRFHILNHYFNFSCWLRRIVVTSPPALHICPPTHLRLTRARHRERERQAKLAAAALRGKSKQALSAHCWPQCNPTLVSRQNAMSYQSQIPCGKSTLSPRHMYVSASLTLTLSHQTQKNSCVSSVQSPKNLFAARLFPSSCDKQSTSSSGKQTREEQ